MSPVSIVYVVRCTYDETIEGIYKTMDSAVEAVNELYSSMFEDDEVSPLDYDDTYTIEEYPLYA